MGEPLLELIGATRSYQAGDQETAETAVLRNIDLTIEAGEFVAIMGASGSGKSTLMNLLGCLDRPSSGHYRVGGIDVGALEPDVLARLRRERFGFIFQRYHLLPHLSAVDNVQVPSIYTGAAGRTRLARAHALLARLGLAERSAHRPNQLSGGQQQRVSVARALMNGADVILADEPTGALDSKSGREVMRILGDLHAAGHTIVVVTHDEQVAAHAHRVVEMSDGVIVGDRRRIGRDETSANAADALPLASPDIQRRKAVGAAGVARVVQALKTAWAALLAHRLRTLLTMLGIVIGIMSVVSIVAIGEGAKRYMLDEISEMGTNTIDVYPGRDWGDSEASLIRTLVAADADALAAEPYIDSVTPGIYRNATVRHGNVDVQVMVSGVGEHFFQVRGRKLATGIQFGEEAVHRHAQVAVIHRTDDSDRQRALHGDRRGGGPAPHVGRRHERPDGMGALYDGRRTAVRRSAAGRHHREDQGGAAGRCGRVEDDGAAHAPSRPQGFFHLQHGQRREDGRIDGPHADAAADAHRGGFAGRRRYRRDEHHARVGH